MTTGELSQWHATNPDTYLPPGLAEPRPWQDGLDIPIGKRSNVTNL